MPKTCFVIGPIGDPDTPTRRAADDFMDYIVGPCPALKELGFEKPIGQARTSQGLPTNSGSSATLAAILRVCGTRIGGCRLSSITGCGSAQGVGG